MFETIFDIREACPWRLTGALLIALVGLTLVAWREKGPLKVPSARVLLLIWMPVGLIFAGAELSDWWSGGSPFSLVMPR